MKRIQIFKNYIYVVHYSIKEKIKHNTLQVYRNLCVKVLYHLLRGTRDITKAVETEYTATSGS